MKKKCTTCKKDRILTKYYKDVTRPDGLSPRCSTCNATKQRIYKQFLKRNNMKKCTTCKCEKSESEFYRDMTTLDKLTRSCKECLNFRAKKKYAEVKALGTCGNSKWQALDLEPAECPCLCSKKSYLEQRKNPCTHKLDIQTAIV